MNNTYSRTPRMGRLLIDCGSWIRILAFLLSTATVGITHADQVVNSTSSGPWSAAATWAGGKVPGAGDKVLVKPGHAVIYDAKSTDVIRGITVAGTLSFAPDKDTELNVGLIRIERREDYS